MEKIKLSKIGSTCSNSLAAFALVLISITFSSISFARGTNSFCPMIKSDLKRHLFIDSGANPNCKKIQELIRNLQFAQTQTNGLGQVSQIDFYFNQRSSEISYLERNSFQASLELTFDPQGQILFRPEQEASLWLHEFGHAILDNQLASDWPWYFERSTHMKRWGNLVAQATILNQQSIQLNHQLEKTTDIKQQQKIEAKIEYLKMESNELNIKIDQEIQSIKSMQNVIAFEDLIAGFHEMFADAFATLDQLNPKLMSLALSNPIDPKNEQASETERQEIADRDYSFVRDPMTWNRSESHLIFTPALAFWWQKLSKKGPLQYLNQKQELRALYQVILSEITERSKNNDLWNLTPAESNQRIIEKIRKLK